MLVPPSNSKFLTEEEQEILLLNFSTSEAISWKLFKQWIKQTVFSYKDRVSYNTIYFTDINEVNDLPDKIGPLILWVWFYLKYNYVEPNLNVIKKRYFDIYGYFFSFFENPNFLVVISKGHISYRTNPKEIYKWNDVIFGFDMDLDMDKSGKKKEIYLRAEQNINLDKYEWNMKRISENLLDDAVKHWHQQEFGYLELDISKIKKRLLERFEFNLYWFQEDLVVTYSKGTINISRSYINAYNENNDRLMVIKKLPPRIIEYIKEEEKKKEEEKNEETSDED